MYAPNVERDNIMITLTVEVTNEHIDMGLTNDCQQCPIALAIMDAIHDSKKLAFDYVNRIEAGTDFIYLYDTQGITIYHAYTPEDAAKFMRQFDAEIDVKPALMSFNFYQPSESSII